MKKSRILNDSYLLINLIFAGIILAVLAYSLIFGGEKAHPVPSASEFITGENTISTGLSRSFSAIVRFDFTKARIYNPYGISIFLFFLIQFFMRIGGSLLSTNPHRQTVIRLDIIISILLFLFLFRPFLKALFL